METPNRDDAGLANAMRIADKLAGTVAITCDQESNEDVAAALLLLVSREMMLYRSIREKVANRLCVDAAITTRIAAVGETVFDALAETLDNIMAQIDRDTAGGNRAETDIQPDNSGTPGGA